MADTKRKRPANFKFEMPVTEGRKQEIMQNLQNVREVLVNKLRRPVNNTDMMQALLDTWRKSLESNDDSGGFKSPGTCTKVKPSGHGAEMPKNTDKSSMSTCTVG